EASFFPFKERSDCLGVHFARADAQRIRHLAEEDLAVTDAAAAGRVADRFHRRLDNLVLNRELDLHLGQVGHRILGTPVDLALSALAPGALYLADRPYFDHDCG